MITVIRGTKESQHNILKAAAIIAEMSAHVYHRKTLVLQAADAMSDVEFLLTGVEQTEEDDIFGLDLGERGIDALLLRAKGERVMKNNFDDLVNPTEPEMNALDVAAPSTAGDIEDEILAEFDAMVNLMKCAASDEVANAPYDNVIVIVDGRNEELSRKVSKAADKVIVVVEQGRPEFEPEFEDKKSAKKDIDLMTDEEKAELEAKEYINWKKYFILVNDFEAESTFNRSALKQAYKAKNIYVLPHNVMFNDACRGGNVRRFVLNNIEADKIDNNYPIIEGVRVLLNALYREQVAKEDEQKLELEAKAREEAKREKEEIKKLNVREKKGKKGFFKKEEDSFEISQYDENPFEDEPKKKKRKGLFGKKDDVIPTENEEEIEYEDEYDEEYIEEEYSEEDIPEEEYDVEYDGEDEFEEEAEEEETDPYEGMTAKELYKQCKAQNIEVEQKKPREYYIELLEAAKDDWDDEEEDDWDDEEEEVVEEVVEEPVKKQKTALDLLKERNQK